MKIFRAIFTELLWNSVLVSLALVTVAALLRFARYLDSAADGGIAVAALLPVILLRLPEFLGLLLPLGALLGVLLMLGRMQADGEISILQNCGISPARLLLYCQWAGLCLLGVSLVLSLYLAPLGRAYMESLLSAPRIAEQAQTLSPGRFFRSGDAALYVDRTVRTDRGARLQGVFLAQSSDRPPAVTVAAGGELQRREEDAGLSLRLERGVTYRPLEGAFDLHRFGSLDYPLSAPSPRIAQKDLRSMSSRELAASGHPAAQAFWHWRLSLSLLPPLAVLFGFALAAPGAGRGAGLRSSWTLALGALICLLYIHGLNMLRDFTADGRLPLLLPLYLHLHLPALLLLTLFLLRRNLYFPRASAARPS